MERQHRDLMVTAACVIVSLAAVLGWWIFSRWQEGPPMVVAGAVPSVPVPALKPGPVPQDSAGHPPADTSHLSGPPATVRIHVVGAVKHAGVYTLPADAR